MKPTPSPGKHFVLTRGNHVVEVKKDMPPDALMVIEAGPGSAWVPVAGGSPEERSMKGEVERG